MKSLRAGVRSLGARAGADIGDISSQQDDCLQDFNRQFRPLHWLIIFGTTSRICYLLTFCCFYKAKRHKRQEHFEFHHVDHNIFSNTILYSFLQFIVKMCGLMLCLLQLPCSLDILPLVQVFPNRHQLPLLWLPIIACLNNSCFYKLVNEFIYENALQSRGTKNMFNLRL